MEKKVVSHCIKYLKVTLFKHRGESSQYANVCRMDGIETCSVS